MIAYLLLHNFKGYNCSNHNTRYLNSLKQNTVPSEFKINEVYKFEKEFTYVLLLSYLSMVGHLPQHFAILFTKAILIICNLVTLVMMMNCLFATIQLGAHSINLKCLGSKNKIAFSHGLKLFCHIVIFIVICLKLGKINESMLHILNLPIRFPIFPYFCIYL